MAQQPGSDLAMKKIKETSADEVLASLNIVDDSSRRRKSDQS